MELINNHYIKIDKYDIFVGIVKASETKNIYKQEYFKNLIDTLLEYEKESKINISEIFLPVNDFTKEEILNIPIKRQTILNAYVFANISGEKVLSAKINKFLSKKEVFSSELVNISDYILDHSMNIDEFFDGESIRFIYDDHNKKIKNGYIFNHEKQKTRVLKEL